MTTTAWSTRIRLTSAALLLAAGCGGAPSQEDPAPGETEIQLEGARLPSACSHSGRGATGLRARVKLDRFERQEHTRDGVHLLYLGRIEQVLAAGNRQLVQPGTVELALRVSTGPGEAGLPPQLHPEAGAEVTVQGEYIARGSHGRPVLHFTHAPCGYVQTAGGTYR